MAGKKLWVRITALLLIVCLSFCTTGHAGYTAQAASEMTDIRVGLTTFYSGKQSLTIKTNKIGMGYSIDNQYTCDVTFTSSTGFMFQPAKGYYFIGKTSYTTYAKAKEAANQLARYGVPVYITAVGRSQWKLYVGGLDSQSEMQNIYKKISSQHTIAFEGPEADNKHRILMSGNGITILIDGKASNSYPQFKSMVSNENGVAVLNLGSRQYRGRIEIGRYGENTLTAVNILNIEAYLYGVVPSEMVSTWPIESLKAQAVCSRSYAQSKTGYGTDSSLTKAYIIGDTTKHQVYKGYGSETVATSKAVNETKGVMIFYNNKVIPSYFFSTSGGRTESSQDVWGNNTNYLKSVPDINELEPEKGPWIIAMSKAELTSRMNTAGYNIGTVTRVVPLIYTVSDRIYSLKVIGTNGSTMLQSEKIRNVLGVYSTKFKVESSNDTPDKVTVLSASGTSKVSLNDSYAISSSGTTKLSDTDDRVCIVKSADNISAFSKEVPDSPDLYYFVGLGYGHGVGMSQSGAKGLANQGYTYKEIVKYYFTGVTVK